jgi:hypothetical protein
MHIASFFVSLTSDQTPILAMAHRPLILLIILDCHESSQSKESRVGRALGEGAVKFSTKLSTTSVDSLKNRDKSSF